MSTINQIIDHVDGFLIRNGFEKIKHGHYSNLFCNIEITAEGYAVADNYGYTAYSSDHNIYWLVGYLTWSDFIDKNYKQ